MNEDFTLPGLGSNMAQAIKRGDNVAAFWAAVAMLVLILATDELDWQSLPVSADR